MANHEKYLWPHIVALSSTVPPDLVLTCIREGDLLELWLPSPRTFEREAAMMLRVRDAGALLFGKSVNTQEPAHFDPKCILAAQLEAFTHYGRNHIVLEALNCLNYKPLMHTLVRTIDSLLASALISRGRWRFTHNTVHQAFSSAFDTPTLHSALDKLDRVLAILSMNMPIDRDLALTLSFLVDHFSAELRCYT